MNPYFSSSFISMKDYLTIAVPELGNIITHVDDPFAVKKNQTIMLPDSHDVSGDSVHFSIRLYISTVEKNADLIALSQMEIMEKLFSAIYYPAPRPVISAAIQSADYFDPVPTSPNVGIMAVLIQMTVNYIDDCEEETT